MSTKLLSLIALAITTLPCLLYFFGSIDHSVMKWLALAGTILWFLSAPLWMGREISSEQSEV